jgi:hypothetical protein
MAPSRTLLHRIASAIAQPYTRLQMRPVARQISTSVVRSQYVPRCVPLQLSLACRITLSIPRTRLYSQEANAGPVAPDYLNEAELHIFNKIKGEMEPTKLEVCVKPDLNFVYPEIGAGAWLTPIAIMHSRPNTSEISIAAHRACTSSEHCSILRGRCGELH